MQWQQDWRVSFMVQLGSSNASRSVRGAPIALWMLRLVLSNTSSHIFIFPKQWWATLARLLLPCSWFRLLIHLCFVSEFHHWPEAHQFQFDTLSSGSVPPLESFIQCCRVLVIRSTSLVNRTCHYDQANRKYEVVRKVPSLEQSLDNEWLHQS